MLRRISPLVALAAVAAVVLPSLPSSAATVDPGTTRPFGAPIGSCFTTPLPRAFAPNQMADLYGLTPLWHAGYQGQGIRMALLDPHEIPDMTEVARFKSCQGITAPVTVTTIGTGAEPAVAGEATLDVEVALTAAPKLEGLYLFSNRRDVQLPIEALLEQAVNPANTGGQQVDAISVSFGGCETKENTDNPGYLDSMNRALEEAASRGISVFFAAGDSGSSACASHPVADGAPGFNVAAIGFPASSPWAVAVGGTQMTRTRQSDGSGVVDSEVVWNEPNPNTTSKDGGGGGTSEFFDMPSWQSAYGLTGGRRQFPDVVALAGTPYYTDGIDNGFWFGTSAASPFTAGSWAVVLSALQANGVAKPGFLSPILYRLAKTDYAKVFRDITIGSNDLWGAVGCCSAGAGYDNASGLGSLRFDGLAAALIPQAPASTGRADFGAADGPVRGLLLRAVALSTGSGRTCTGPLAGRRCSRLAPSTVR
ncbi:MAG: S53 family peptidase [Actinobacteria bacterium]|nr:S53 family peptidase [Actinomycetota bacterium]